GGDPERGHRVRGHGLPGHRADDAPAEAAEGAPHPAAEGREPSGRAEAGGRRARDREAEGVADRRGAVAEPPPPAHPGDEERGRPAQPDVRRVTRATDRGRRPTGSRAGPISQRVYCFEGVVKYLGSVLLVEYLRGP